MAIFDHIQEVIEFHQEQAAKEQSLRRTNPLNVKVEVNWQKAFEAINSKGVEAFGWDWIRANESAISAASNLGVNYEHPQIRVFMQNVVFAVLERTLPTNQNQQWPE